VKLKKAFILDGSKPVSLVLNDFKKKSKLPPLLKESSGIYFLV
jgi:hypothetical protein